MLGFSKSMSLTFFLISCNHFRVDNVIRSKLFNVYMTRHEVIIKVIFKNPFDRLETIV